MSHRKKPACRQTGKAFTLIELIIVVVIIGILALVAIPRYFANVAKAEKSHAFANLDAIKRAQLAYYAVYGVYTSDFPITVVVDGETIVNLSYPGSTIYSYAMSQSGTAPCAPSWALCAYKRSNGCSYCICIATAGDWYSSCTP
ncbi:MAG: prepilin-type N-terminal cleavage/methylation domain-containing protein [Candidatus Omnitrophota bacterium]|jgi:prepilin-type N-terminal cleavage/methylation domain-containing protein